MEVHFQGRWQEEKANRYVCECGYQTSISPLIDYKICKWSQF